MNDSDISLWEALGLSPDSALEPPPADVWDAAVGAAVDPDAVVVATELVPEQAPDVSDDDDIVLDHADQLALGGEDDAAWDVGTADIHTEDEIVLNDPSGAGPDDLDQGW